MALMTAQQQKLISAFRVAPTRASGAANANNGVDTVGSIDFTVDVPNAGPVSHRANEYVLTMPPNNTIIPKPNIGDKAYVYYCDATAGAVNPTAYEEYVYTPGVTAGTGVASGAASWKKVTMA
jgi:hypothetical protein